MQGDGKANILIMVHWKAHLKQVQVNSIYLLVITGTAEAYIHTVILLNTKYS